jgi:hypothetical protein
MRAGTEDKKKLITAGVGGFCAIVALGWMYFQVFAGPSAPPPVQGPPVVITKPSAAGDAEEAGPRPAASVPAVVAPAAARLGNGPGAKKVATANVQLDPTLHMEAMEATESLVYTGTGRNIFAPGPTPQELLAVAPKPIAPARPGPSAPIRPVNLGPPPKPPINLKFFGTATQGGKRRALLLAGDDVFLASPGDIVQRRYRIVSIGANSIVVEDVANSNSQNLPLVVN